MSHVTCDDVTQQVRRRLQLVCWVLRHQSLPASLTLTPLCGVPALQVQQEYGLPSLHTALALYNRSKGAPQTRLPSAAASWHES